MLKILDFKDNRQACLPLLDDEVEIEIQACDLKFRDVLITLGQLAADNLEGEYVGIAVQAISFTPATG